MIARGRSRLPLRPGAASPNRVRPALRTFDGRRITAQQRSTFPRVGDRLPICALRCVAERGLLFWQGGYLLSLAECPEKPVMVCLDGGLVVAVENLIKPLKRLVDESASSTEHGSQCLWPYDRDGA